MNPEETKAPLKARLARSKFRGDYPGLYREMHGNDSEWCRDLYGLFDAGAQVYPTGPETGGNRVIRGGGWDDTSDICRSAWRLGSDSRTARERSVLRVASKEAPGFGPGHPLDFSRDERNWKS